MDALDFFQTVHDLFQLDLDPIFTASFLKTLLLADSGGVLDCAILDAHLPEMPDYDLSERMISQSVLNLSVQELIWREEREIKELEI